MLFIEFDMCSVYIGTPSTELVPPTSVDAMETIRRVTEPSVSTLFASMEYGPAKESRKVADSWLDKHQRHFGLFINNEWVHPDGGRKTYETHSPGSGEVLAATTQARAEMFSHDFKPQTRALLRMSRLL